MSALNLSPERNQATVLLEKIGKCLEENPGKPVQPNPNTSELPRAAVAMILKPDPVSGDVSILFIERKVRENDPWSGNMALPGGRVSAMDKDILATAVREVREETGLDLRDFTILGSLDEVISTNFLIRVTPFVATIPMRNYAGDDEWRELSLEMEAREVESHVWIPLSYFMDRKNATTMTIERLGRKVGMPCYRFGDEYVVWGMTLRIIEDLLAKLR